MDMVAVLSAMDEDAMVHLLEQRPDLLGPWVPRSLTELASRAESWASVQRALLDLDALCLAVLDGLCLLPPAATEGSLAQLLGPGVTTAQLSPALGRLARLGLVRVHDHRVETVRGLRERAQYPARLGRPVAALLGRQSVSYLSGVAAHLGLPAVKGKAELLVGLTQALSDPGIVGALVDTLEIGAVQLVYQLAYAGPTAYASPHVQWRGERRVSTVPALLMSLGLLAPLDWDRVEMPREVGLALRGGRPFPDLAPEPPAIVTHPVPAESVEAQAARAATDLLRQVADLLQEWEARPPKWLKVGGVAIRDVRRTAKALGLDERATCLVAELAAAAGLAGPDHGIGDVLLTAAADRWLDQEPAQRWLALVAGWVSCVRDPGLAGTPNPDANDRPWAALTPMRVPEARDRRVDLLGALGRLPAGVAPDPTTLAANLAWMAPGRWGPVAATGEGPLSPMLQQAAVLGLTGEGCLGRAGRLALSGDQDGAEGAAREMMPTPVTTITFQADLTAVAAGQLDPAVGAELALLADLESRGAASVWRITEASLGRAFDAGRSAEQLVAFLEAHAARGVPQPLTYLVADVGRRHGQLRAGPAAAYVRAEDPALLAEVVRARRTAKLDLRLLAPTVAVTTAPAPRVLEVLRAAGYLPAAEDRDGVALVARAPRRRSPTPGGAPAPGRPVRLLPEAGAAGPARVLAGPGSGRPQATELVRLVRALRPSKPGIGRKGRPRPASRPQARQGVPA